MNNVNEYYYRTEFIDIVNKLQTRRKCKIINNKSYPISQISNIILDNSYYINKNEYRLPIDLYNYIDNNNKMSYTYSDIYILVKKYITTINYNNDLFNKYIVIGYNPNLVIEQLDIYL